MPTDKPQEQGRQTLSQLTVHLVNPTEILVHGGEDLAEWRRRHTFPVPNRDHMPRFKSGAWDGLRRPGKWLRRDGNGGWKFHGSRGLLHRLREIDARVCENLLPPQDSSQAAVKAALAAAKHEPFDYQEQAALDVLAHRWCRIALATNAGKGGIIGVLAAGFQQVGLRTLILSDEVEVFRALADEIPGWGGAEPEPLKAGVKDPPQGPVVLAMVPTLARRLKDDPATWRPWLATFEAAFLDEADKATAPTWRSVVSQLKRTEYRAGFSGSFLEEGDADHDPYNDLVLDEMLGPVRLRINNMLLVERGVSARPQVTLVPYEVGHQICRPDLHTWWKKMSGPARRRLVYEHAVVENEDRHRFIASLVRPGVPTCVIVNRVEHGHLLEQALPAAVFLSGKDSETTRDAVLEKFAEGAFQVLIVTKILDRGSNRLGHAVDLIFAASEGSSRQTLQRIGRGLRRAGGKEYLRLVDVVDRGDRYLHKAARKRLEVYRREQFDVEIERVPAPPEEGTTP